MWNCPNCEINLYPQGGFVECNETSCKFEGCESCLKLSDDEAYTYYCEEHYLPRHIKWLNDKIEEYTELISKYKEELFKLS